MSGRLIQLSAKKVTCSHPIEVTAVGTTSGLGLGCAKTKSDLVVMPSGRQIFAFFRSPHNRRPQNSGCGAYLLALEIERAPATMPTPLRAGPSFKLLRPRPQSGLTGRRALISVANFSRAPFGGTTNSPGKPTIEAGGFGPALGPPRRTGGHLQAIAGRQSRQKSLNGFGDSAV